MKVLGGRWGFRLVPQSLFLSTHLKIVMSSEGNGCSAHLSLYRRTH